jgi:uncharacterized protein (TIGR03067 family)
MIPDDSLFLGEWQPIRAEFDGVEAPQMALEQMALTLRPAFYRIKFGGEMADEGTVAAILKEAQLELTMTAMKGENRGRVVVAIAQVRGDRMRVCFGLNGVAPSSFTTAPGSERYLVTYKRTSNA